MLVYILGIVLFALGICISVALHEAGHMVAAKAFGMKVRRYFIGFGPKVFSFRRGETEYGVKWLPLGGFCDIAGMTAMDEVTPQEAPRAMWRYKVWKRTVVMVAGSVTHFILGFVVLYLLAVTFGLPNIFSTPSGPPTVGTIAECVKRTVPEEGTRQNNCAPTDPAPAQQGGLRTGDKVLAVGDIPTDGWREMVIAIRHSSGPTPVTVVRDGARLTLTVDVATLPRQPLTEAEKAAAGPDGLVQVGVIGAARQTEARYLHYGPVDAIGASFTFTGEMFARTWQGILHFPERIPAVVESIFGEERPDNTPISVVGASRIGGELAQAGLWAIFLLLLASLNFFIGVFNLLPLLPLDGGHIAVTWYERVRDWFRNLRGKQAGGPVDYTKLTGVTMVFIFIGGAVVLLTVIADVVNPVQVLN